ncbi:MAG: PilW family protein [Aquabacterium sp.]|uniref:PilW family protein n=1 Tax=Aquabacterium sp. TaxID=1872578 RepID=UPI0025B95C05|nr:PilW family protein [Aquabacterium sp.]MBI3381240.1 PilW family protein [Aquabacterium sp.]
MNAAFDFHRRTSLRQTGLTLVELLVAMVVGLSVIGASLAMYASSGSSSRSGSQIAQMSEDANAALSLLRTHVAMAGYSRPIGTTSTGLTKLYSGQAIFGCQNGLSSTSTSQAISKGAVLTCEAGAPSANDTLIVLYEADTSNTIPTAANQGTDCLGNGVPLITTDPKGNYYLAENRFYLSANGSLLCRGNGTATGAPGVPQPVVDNIADFSVMYGVAEDNNSGGTAVPGTFAKHYLTAGELGAQADTNWNNVVSVRLCVVVQSEDNALDQITPYRDCHGNTVTPTSWTPLNAAQAKPDLRSRRLFTSTVVLHNRAQQSLE